ncbi:MAG: hypothetical protein ACE5D2_06000, partial [Fidelibacterota bacterium]
MIDHKILLRKTIVPLILFLTISGLWSQQSGAVPTRTEIEEQYTWDLKPLYHSDQDWETDFKKLDAKIKLFSNYVGQLGKSEQQLLECLQLKDQTGILMGRLSAYASRLRDQDLGNTTNQARAQRIQSLGTKLSNATAFIEPEILEINDRKLNQFKRKVKGLALYDFY